MSSLNAANDRIRHNSSLTGLASRIYDLQGSNVGRDYPSVDGDLFVNITAHRHSDAQFAVDAVNGFTMNLSSRDLASLRDEGLRLLLSPHQKLDNTCSLQLWIEPSGKVRLSQDNPTENAALTQVAENVLRLIEAKNSKIFA